MGFSNFMMRSYESNRNLLKGNDSSVYKSFDKSYKAKSGRSRKPVRLVRATPEYLAKLKQQLTAYKKKRRVAQVSGLVVAVLTVSFLFYLLLA